MRRDWIKMEREEKKGVGGGFILTRECSVFALLSDRIMVDCLLKAAV